MNLDISNANSSAVLTVSDLFPSGITLEMFSTDQAIDQGTPGLTETRMGIDGHMVAAYVPTIHTVAVKLEAASPSFDALATVWTAMNKRKKVYECTLVCSVPSLGRTFTWSRGVMKSGTPFPSLGKSLGVTTWTFDFESFNPSKD